MIWRSILCAVAITAAFVLILFLKACYVGNCQSARSAWIANSILLAGCGDTQP